MKWFELSSLLVVVFEFGLFGAVNGNFRVERQSIGEQRNLVVVHLLGCTNNLITSDEAGLLQIQNNTFIVTKSNEGRYWCQSNGESVVVIRKPSILLL